MSISRDLVEFVNLYSRTSPNPCPITPKWTPPVIHIHVLKARTQLELIRSEIKPPIKNSSRISMLNLRTTDKRLDDIVLRRDEPDPTSRDTIDHLVDLSLQRIDVVDGVLLTGSHVQPSSIISREASLLTAQLSGENDRAFDLGIRCGEIGHDALRHVVVAARRQYAPVDITALQRDAVAACRGEGFPCSVPAVDRLAVVGAYVSWIGARVGRIEEAADGGAAVEVDGHDGPRGGFVGYEGEARCTDGVVDAHVVSVEVVVGQRWWDRVAADQSACG